MISRSLLTGTVVLLAACLAEAGPCRPSSIGSSSTDITSVSEIATSSFESETATSTASIDATQTATTATESESESETVFVETTPSASSIDTTTTALPDTTTTELAVTSTEATSEATSDATTTTAAASTTTEADEAVQSVYIYAHGSTDPSLDDIGGIGFAELSDTQIPDVQYIDFTANVNSQLFFTVGSRSGKVKIGNGANIGKVAGYFPISDYSLVIAVEASLSEENDVPPLDCEIIEVNGFQRLQCEYGDKGNADFWTCDGHWVLVSPGVDFTSRCPRATTSYKVEYIMVNNAS